MRAMGSAPASGSAALSLAVAVALPSLGLLLVPLIEPAGSVGLGDLLPRNGPGRDRLVLTG
jgi:hypothetical protein